jgi:curved DNA-binding protein CbpA
MVRVDPDPYLVLGVPPTATQAEITHAYRTHLRAHHPDTRPARSAHTADEHLRQCWPPMPCCATPPAGPTTTA